MHTRTKSVMIIVSTLLIGAVLGSLLTSYFAHKNFRDRIAGMRKPDRFVERMQKIIEPDSLQRPALDSLLYDHFDKIETSSSLFRRQIDSLNDSLRTKLNNILTDEQMSRYEEYRKKLHRRFKRNGKPQFPR